jgi:hypothetical protein
MKDDLRNKQALRLGEKIALEHGFTALPVDPFKIAEAAQITIQAKPEELGGVSGMLLKSGSNFGILYATHIKSVGFQRFSIAHELGHYFLPEHPEALFATSNRHESQACFSSKDIYEIEADNFAAGLLMPSSLFIPAMKKAGDGLQALKHLAELCQTSLLATAIRYTQCAKEPLAIIVSSGNTIEYGFMSEELKEIKGIDWVKKGSILSKDTPTYGFNQTHEYLNKNNQSETSSNFQDWFGGNHRQEISEDIISLGDYGKTLTILFNIELPEDIEEDTDHWQPRFR